MTDKTTIPAFGAYTYFGVLRAAIVCSTEGLAIPPFNPSLHHYNDEMQVMLKAIGGITAL